MQVGAVQDIKEDLAVRKAALQKRLVLELERLVYHVSAPDASTKKASGGQQPLRPPKLGKGASVYSPDSASMWSVCVRQPLQGQ